MKSVRLRSRGESVSSRIFSKITSKWRTNRSFIHTYTHLNMSLLIECLTMMQWTNRFKCQRKQFGDNHRNRRNIIAKQCTNFTFKTFESLLNEILCIQFLHSLLFYHKTIQINIFRIRIIVILGVFVYSSGAGAVFLSGVYFEAMLLLCFYFSCSRFIILYTFQQCSVVHFVLIAQNVPPIKPPIPPTNQQHATH